VPRSPDPDLAPARTVREAAAGIAVLAAAHFVAITTEMLPVGLLPLISRGVEVSESTAGLLVTVYAFVVAAAAVPLTVATRAFARKPLLLGTLVAYAASNLVVALAPSYTLLAVGRTFGGLAHAIFFSVSIAYASRLVSPLHTGRALTLVTAGGTLGFVLGVPLSTSLGTAVGWRWSFGILAAMCLVTSLLVARLLPAVAVEPARAAGSGPRPGRGRLALVVVAITVLFAGHYTVYTYVSPLLLSAGLSPEAVGPVLLVFGAVGLVGLWVAARYLDRSPRAVALAAIAVIAGTLVVIAFTLSSAAGLLVAAGVWLAAFGAVPATTQAAALRTRGASPDIIGAFVNGSSNLGIGVGAAVGAAVIAGPGSQALALTGAGIVAVALGVVLLARAAFPRDPA